MMSLTRASQTLVLNNSGAMREHRAEQVNEARLGI